MIRGDEKRGDEKRGDEKRGDDKRDEMIKRKNKELSPADTFLDTSFLTYEAARYVENMLMTNVSQKYNGARGHTSSS